jgi:leucyl aminopeptidase
MKISVKNLSLTEIKCDLLIVNMYEDIKTLGGSVDTVDRKLDGAIKDLIKAGEISGKLGQINVIHTQGKLPARQVAVVGMGKRTAFKLDDVRTVAGSAMAEAKRIKAQKVATVVHGAGRKDLNVTLVSQALVEGTLIEAYRYKGFTTVKDDTFFEVDELLIVEISPKKMKAITEGAKAGQIIAQSVNNARDLVNGPSNLVTPTYLANWAKKIPGVSIEVLGLKESIKRGFDAFCSIAKGAREPSKFIIVRYGKGRPEIALVGKGITFDSGGISLKPSRKLWEMKTDMSGAAAVLETMRAISKLKIKKNVVALLPCTENMPQEDVLKPGDVIGSLSGKTIEIISTDAEGRLVISDAITFAKKLKVKKIIDVATLTGACVVALGDVASAIMGNDPDLINQLISAGKACGEKIWQMPLFDDYKEYSKSKVADIKNATEVGKAGTSVGGIFLKLFAEDTPWAHIDIAGTAFFEKERDYLSYGATGVMVRTLVEFIRSQ